MLTFATILPCKSFITLGLNLQKIDHPLTFSNKYLETLALLCVRPLATKRGSFHCSRTENGICPVPPRMIFIYSVFRSQKEKLESHRNFGCFSCVLRKVNLTCEQLNERKKAGKTRVFFNSIVSSNLNNSLTAPRLKLSTKC